MPRWHPRCHSAGVPSPKLTSLSVQHAAGSRKASQSASAIPMVNELLAADNAEWLSCYRASRGWSTSQRRDRQPHRVIIDVFSSDLREGETDPTRAPRGCGCGPIARPVACRPCTRGHLTPGRGTEHPRKAIIAPMQPACSSWSTRAPGMAAHRPPPLRHVRTSATCTTGGGGMPALYAPTARAHGIPRPREHPLTLGQHRVHIGLSELAQTGGTAWSVCLVPNGTGRV